MISIESGESAEARPREAAASQNTAACIEACRLDELFSDSKFLRAESLIEMVKALMWAAGPVNRIAASGEESDTAEVRQLLKPLRSPQPSLPPPPFASLWSLSLS